MCRPATCRVCGKASWVGCGQHVDQVLAGVPKDRRCSCGPDHKAPAGAGGGGKGFLARLFSR